MGRSRDDDATLEWLAEQALCHDDEEALGQLWERMTPRIYGLLRAIVHRPADLPDLLQETWLRIVQSEYRPGGNFSGWVLTIAHNLAIDYLKKEARRTKREKEKRRVLNPVQPDDELLERLRDCVERLDQLERAIIAERYWADRDYRSIAESLSLPAGTVRRKCHEARRKLDRCMQLGENRKH